jgi:hypothetical protein
MIIEQRALHAGSHGRSWPEARATLQKIDSADVRSWPIPLKKGASSSSRSRMTKRWPTILFQAGSGIGISFASFLRFWTVAASINSSCAPFGPRNLRRSSLRMRLRCANSISTFLRRRRAMRPCHVRSGMPCRGHLCRSIAARTGLVLLDSIEASGGRLGSHTCSRYRNVAPSLIREPVVVSIVPPGQ